MNIDHQVINSTGNISKEARITKAILIIKGIIIEEITIQETTKAEIGKPGTVVATEVNKEESLTMKQATTTTSK